MNASKELLCYMAVPLAKPQEGCAASFPPLHKKTGEAVRAGESLATFYTSDPALLAEAEEVYRSALTFGPKPPKLPPMVQARVTEAGVERF